MRTKILEDTAYTYITYEQQKTNLNVSFGAMVQYHMHLHICYLIIYISFSH